jgi:hypothetical protein
MKELRQAELGKRKGSYADKNIEHTTYEKEGKGEESKPFQNCIVPRKIKVIDEAV